MISASDILKSRILIVDDKAANVALLEQMLQRAGYVAVTSTQNPLEVCDLHRANRYDLILLDLQMPVMDGFEVMAGLKAIEPGAGLPVLVITATPDHKIRALKAGAGDFVSKPFEIAEILLRARNMLEIRLLHQKLTDRNFERLENAQRIAGLGDWEYDCGRRRLSWSDGIYRVLGIGRNDFPPSAETFDALVHSDDLALVQREKKAAAQSDHRVEFEHRIIRPDREVRHIHQIAETSFDAQHRPVRQTGTLQDITDRKHREAALHASEERFKFVARAVSDVVWDWDLTANTLWWNDGFLKTFGYDAGQIDASVASRDSRIHADDRDRVLESLRRAIAGGAETWGAEYRIQRRDGTYVVVQDRGYIVRDAAGGVLRVVGGMRDLTEQKKMEAQFLRAQRMESIGTLAGGIAHDLNNVLAPIMMAVELLKRDASNDPKRIRVLDTIDISSRRGSDLVRQVLSFARGLDSKRVLVRLRNQVEDLQGIISEIFPRDIHIVVTVPTDLWPITGDPIQLHQVLLNLAVNARDAMPHGGTLTLSASNLNIDAQYAGMTPEAKAGPHVLLKVSDTGVGIAPEVRERIFEPFFTTKEPGKGTGIGLATVHSVVKGHGGFVNFESELGRGTTFKVYLPADPAYLTADTERAPVPDLPAGRDELVLVVDDEYSIREITQQTLETFGYRVLTARDGAEAVALYVKHVQEIAIVLTDMMMPVMDGAATIQVLRRINPAVRVIAASGIDSGDPVANAGIAGVKHFLLKPFTAECLLTLMREALDQP